MSIRSTAQDALYLLAAAALGAFLGTFVFSGWMGPDPTDRQRGAISRDSSQLTWDELTAGLLPDETTVYDRTPTVGECLSVPGLLVDRTRPPPDTVTQTEYRTLFTAQAEPDAPAITYGERSGLDRIGQSRHPFLFLPVTGDGEPAIDHDGRRTVVPAFSQTGRPYEFTYRYDPPSWRLFAEAYLAGRWWPPLRPRPGDVRLAGGVDMGVRYKKGRVQLGPRFSSAFGPAVRVKSTWRFATFTP